MPSLVEDPSSWRLRTSTLDIPYRLVERSGSIEEESASLVEKYLIEAKNIYQFAIEAYPGSTVIGNSIFYERPGIPTNTPMWPMKMAWKAYADGKPIDPFAVDPNAPDGTYGEFAEVTINYETGKGTEGPDPFTFLEISADATPDFIHSTAPSGKWEPAEGASPNEPKKNNRILTTPINLLQVSTTWTVTFPQVPHSFLIGSFMASARNKLGSVNSTTMPIFFDAIPETILFSGISLSKQFTWRSNEQPPWKVTLKFFEKNVGGGGGHNHMWKADEGWRRILYNGVSPIYDPVNLNTLFQ